MKQNKVTTSLEHKYTINSNSHPSKQFIALFSKKKWLDKKWLLKLFVIATPLGFIALEAGWTVTEVGRQPWIIHGVMRTADAVTPMPGIAYSFYLFTAVYISLAFIVSVLLYRQIKYLRS